MGNSKIAVTIRFSGTTSLIYKVETESQGEREDDNQRESKYQVSRCYALCGELSQGGVPVLIPGEFYQLSVPFYALQRP